MRHRNKTFGGAPRKIRHKNKAFSGAPRRMHYKNKVLPSPYICPYANPPPHPQRRTPSQIPRGGEGADGSGKEEEGVGAAVMHEGRRRGTRRCYSDQRQAPMPPRSPSPIPASTSSAPPSVRSLVPPPSPLCRRAPSLPSPLPC
jgi:hypothetical protein